MNDCENSKERTIMEYNFILSITVSFLTMVVHLYNVWRLTGYLNEGNKRLNERMNEFYKEKFDEYRVVGVKYLEHLEKRLKALEDKDV